MSEPIADLLVIGGGIHGCAAALFAARRGLRVVLLEKDTIGRHASGANAGGVRRLNRDPAEIPLSDRSMALWPKLPEIVGEDCGFVPCAQIRVAENDADMELLEARAAGTRALGFSHEVVIDRQELRARLPAVAPHCTGGLMSLDGYAEPLRTTAAFGRAARAAGVRIEETAPVRRLRHDAGLWQVETAATAFRARQLLIAAGAWSGALAAQAGDRLPVEAIAPLMIVTQRMAPFCDAVVGVARRPLSFKQMPNGTVVIGGGRLGRADPGTNETRLDFAELARTAATARDIFPVMRGAVVQRAWSGIEGRTPDRLPIVGRSPSHESLFYATGFSAHGFQLGPGTGQLLAGLIADGADVPEFAPLSPARFAVESAHTTPQESKA